MNQCSKCPAELSEEERFYDEFNAEVCPDCYCETTKCPSCNGNGCLCCELTGTSASQFDRDQAEWRLA